MQKLSKLYIQREGSEKPKEAVNHNNHIVNIINTKGKKVNKLIHNQL